VAVCKIPLMMYFICRASMIWIIGEYAERIDNADELLENFLDGFHDENTQVNYELLSNVDFSVRKYDL